jgi:hypothetical protein
MLLQTNKQQQQQQQQQHGVAALRSQLPPATC